MSPCGLPAQLTLQAALHPEDREDILGVESEAVYFWAAGPADIMVEVNSHTCAWGYPSIA